MWGSKKEKGNVIEEKFEEPKEESEEELEYELKPKKESSEIKEETRGRPRLKTEITKPKEIPLAKIISGEILNDGFFKYTLITNKILGEIGDEFEI